MTIQFTYKENSKWIGIHNNVIYYLYTSNPITLIQYCQEFDKKKTFICEDVYDAIHKIKTLTDKQATFRLGELQSERSTLYCEAL